MQEIVGKAIYTAEDKRKANEKAQNWRLARKNGETHWATCIIIYNAVQRTRKRVCRSLIFFNSGRTGSSWTQQYQLVTLRVNNNNMDLKSNIQCT